MINQTSLFTSVSECTRNIGNEGQNINFYINELHLHWISIESKNKVENIIYM